MTNTYTGKFNFTGNIEILPDGTIVLHAFGKTHKRKLMLVQSCDKDLDLRSYTLPANCASGFFVDDNTGEIVIISHCNL